MAPAPSPVVKMCAVSVDRHVGAVVEPIATIQVSGMAQSILRSHFQVQWQVAVAKDETVIGFPIQYIATMMEEPLSLRTGILGFCRRT